MAINIGSVTWARRTRFLGWLMRGQAYEIHLDMYMLPMFAILILVKCSDINYLNRENEFTWPMTA
jgi:hypothetical protein